MRFKCLPVVAMIVSSAFTSSATTYFWYPKATWGRFSDVDNWRTDAVDGTIVPETPPGPSDNLSRKTEGYHYSLDLGGNSHTVAAHGSDFGGWRQGNFQITNGTLNVTGDFNERGGNTTVWNGGKLVVSGHFFPEDNATSIAYVKVKNGGELVLDGTYTALFNNFEVEQGGTATLDCQFKFKGYGCVSKPQTYASNACYCASSIVNNGGTLIFPKGYVWTSGAAQQEPDTDKPAAIITLEQRSGTLRLGGPVSRDGKMGQLTFNYKGGSLDVTAGTVTFTGCDTASVADGVTLAANVAVGTTLDLNSVSFGAGASVTKTGEGSIARRVADTFPLTVQAGALRLEDAFSSFPAGVTLSSGTKIVFATAGNRLDELTADGVSFDCDWNRFFAGDVVFSSSDAALLTRVLADLSATAPSKFRVLKVGDSIRISGVAPNTFDASACSDLSNAAAWGGTIPDASSDVMLAAAEGPLTEFSPVSYDTGSTVFHSLSLAEGVSLDVAGGTENEPLVMPPVNLNGRVRIRFLSGFTCFTNGYDSLARADTLPIFEVCTGAVVRLPGRLKWTSNVNIASTAGATACDHTDSFKFRNVDLRLYGTLRMPPQSANWSTGEYDINRLTFGWAANGETTYFAMTADGGYLDIPGHSWAASGSYGQVYFATPQPGGCVKVVRPIELRNFTRAFDSNGTLDGWTFGVNNPVSEKFEVRAGEGTLFHMAGPFAVGGGATVKLSDGAVIDRLAMHETHPTIAWQVPHGITLSAAGSLEVGAGSSVVLSRNDGNDAFGQGFRARERNDGTACAFRLTGGRIAVQDINGGGTPVEVEGGFWDVGKQRPKKVDGPEALVEDVPAFNGFSSLAVLGPGDLAFRATDDYREISKMSTDGNWKYWTMPFPWQWDRLARLDLPVTGAGSISVSNTLSGALADYTMTLRVGGSANTCTGTAEACPVSDTGAKSYLEFQDGANWAGTVVANGAARLCNTNAADEAGLPARATFGAMLFKGDFPIRLWKENDVLTNDFVEIAGDCSVADPNAKVGLYGVGMDGYVPVAGERFVVGRIPALAVPPPAARDWKVTAVADPDDASSLIVKLSYSPFGMTFILR